MQLGDGPTDDNLPSGSAAEGDLAEDRPVVGDSATSDPEAPLADALEQRAPLGDADPAPGGVAERPDEANVADVAEQARSVGSNDEDRRAR